MQIGDQLRARCCGRVAQYELHIVSGKKHIFMVHIYIHICIHMYIYIFMYMYRYIFIYYICIYMIFKYAYANGQAEGFRLEMF